MLFIGDCLQVAIEAPATPRSPTKASGRSSPVEKIDDPGVISYVQDGVKQTVNYYAKNCDRPLQVGDKVSLDNCHPMCGSFLLKYLFVFCIVSVSNYPLVLESSNVNLNSVRV